MVKVVKFGGSSLADADQFAKVKEIIEADPDRRYVVCSAPGKRFDGDSKVTDLLLMVYQLASHDLKYGEVFQQIEDRYNAINQDLGLGVALDFHYNEIKENIEDGASEDYVVSRGEYLNGILLAKYLGYDFVDSAELIKFNGDGRYYEEKTEEAIDVALEGVEKAVIPGFYGSDQEGHILTFSRGGSDVTGSIIADGVDADLYENWTDVPGFLVADPNIVPDAKPMKKVTHKELRELAYMGAPVMHEEAIFPVKRKAIKIHIKNTNNPKDPGTLIVNEEPENIRKGKITGIAGTKGFTVINIEKTWMNKEIGFLRKIIAVFEANEVSIEHIPSSVDSVSIIVRDEELRGKEEKIIKEIEIYSSPDDISMERDLALLTVVGHGMASVKGISARIFTSLADAGVNVKMISQGASEISIIIGIAEDDFERAVEAIYRKFID